MRFLQPVSERHPVHGYNLYREVFLFPRKKPVLKDDSLSSTTKTGFPVRGYPGYPGARVAGFSIRVLGMHICCLCIPGRGLVDTRPNSRFHFERIRLIVRHQGDPLNKYKYVSQMVTIFSFISFPTPHFLQQEVVLPVEIVHSRHL